MIFQSLDIEGVYLVEMERHIDARGFFARTWCSREFGATGLNPSLVQASSSFNKARGTVRGMHMQLPPSREAKLVRCTRGVIFDVVVDMRPDSRTYLKHCCVELRAESGTALYIPVMIAHGFQTLADDTEVLYQMTDFFAPELAIGFRWNDPAFGIEWPISQDIVISERDANCKDFDPDAYARCL